MELFAQLVKADFNGEFWGTMCAREKDHDGEIINWEGAKKAVQDWSSGMADVSGQRNFGNIREQHTGNAIGKLLEPPSIDEKNKCILVHGIVVDKDAKDKLEQGIFTGLSIGGNYASRRPLGNGTTEYTPELAELSLVDKPCSPSATLSLVRADGSVLQKHFKPSIDSRVNPNERVSKSFNFRDCPGSEPLSRAERARLLQQSIRPYLTKNSWRNPEKATGSRVRPNQARADAGLPFADISSGSAGSYARYHGATPVNLDNNADANRAGTFVARD